MALFQISYPSKVLRREALLSVCLPNVRFKDAAKEVYDWKKKFAVLYLLHGAGGNHLDWIRYSCVERLADEYQVAVVMPAADLGFYTDMKYGSPYFTYVAEELPRYMEKVFPISDDPRERFAAGLSMGGYGAMKLGLTYPERFAAVASMSGVLDVKGLMREEELAREIELDQVLGWFYGNLAGAKTQENDFCSLLERAAERRAELPRLFQCVGTEDFLYEINQTFLNKAKELKIDLVYEEEPGIHEWDYWEKKLPRVFEWMFSERKG